MAAAAVRIEAGGVAGVCAGACDGAGRVVAAVVIIVVVIVGAVGVREVVSGGFVVGDGCLLVVVDAVVVAAVHAVLLLVMGWFMRLWVAVQGLMWLLLLRHGQV